MTSSVIVVGAGIVGRLVALECCRRGLSVHIIDEEAGSQPVTACSQAAAGMLAPLSELEHADKLVFELGKNSTALWREIIEFMGEPVFFQDEGTLVVSQEGNRQDLKHFHERLLRKLNDTTSASILPVSNIADVEPDLAARYDQALFVRGEGQVDNREALAALQNSLLNLGVRWDAGRAERLSPHVVELGGKSLNADCVIDCRGIGAAAANDDFHAPLRAVRGEVIEVEAPNVSLMRPIRVLHHRWPIYVVPRRDKRYLIGATSFETDDLSPVQVESALELLSAACRLHDGFCGASITGMRVGLRPAFPDNLPRVDAQPGLIRVNGLYRHGFLLGPRMAQIVADRLLAANTIFNTNVPALSR